MKPDQVPEHYYQWLEEIQAFDFVLTELNLYLDTHPTDKQALEQYNVIGVHRKQLVDRFEKEFGPMKNFGQSCSRFPFEWIKTPWPWQV